MTDAGMAYSTSVYDIPTIVVFKFVGGKLARTGNMFQSTYADKNKYVEEFQLVKAALVQKYGNPSVQSKDPSNKNDAARWGEAIASGRMSLVAGWELNATKITLLLEGGNFKIKHTLIYDSIEYAHALHEEEAAEQMHSP